MVASQYHVEAVFTPHGMLQEALGSLLHTQGTQQIVILHVQ